MIVHSVFSMPKAASIDHVAIILKSTPSVGKFFADCSQLSSHAKTNKQANKNPLPIFLDFYPCCFCSFVWEMMGVELLW